MTDFANFSGGTSYVRSLIRKQLRQQLDEPAWERLHQRFRERLLKSGEIMDYNEETPSFVTMEENKNVSETEQNKREVNTEDEDAEEKERSSQEREGSKKASWSPSNAADSLEIMRRQSVPQYAASGADKQFTLGSTDVHSKILNLRLSLAENVMRNYRKYIRTPDETNATHKRVSQFVKGDGSVTDKNEIAARRGSKKPGIMEETFAQTDGCTLVSRLSCLSIPDGNTSGSTDTVSSSSVVVAEDSFRDAPKRVRRNSSPSYSVNWKALEDDSIPFLRSQTDLTSDSTEGKAEVKPRLIRTSHGRRQIARSQVIKELRKDYKALSRNKRLSSCVHDNKDRTCYERLQREQAKRKIESAIFHQEMEEIMTSLKGINCRLDQRMKVLDCGEHPQTIMNLKLHRAKTVAFLGNPIQ